jgi:hypothetical protein
MLNRIAGSLWTLTAIVAGALLLPACNALNPLCGSARPAPTIASLSTDSIEFDLVPNYLLSVNGSKFVASTVVIVNGTPMPTTVVSSAELQVVLNTDVITGPGTTTVAANTPAGNTAYAGCTSGGTTDTLDLTVVSF